MSAIWNIKGAQAVTHRRCRRQCVVSARLPQLGIGAAVHAAGRAASSTHAAAGCAAAGRHPTCRVEKYSVMVVTNRTPLRQYDTGAQGLRPHANTTHVAVRGLPGGGAPVCCFCPGAEEPPRAELPLAERLEDLAAPAAMWMSSRISASLWGQVMRRCRAPGGWDQQWEGAPVVLLTLRAAVRAAFAPSQGTTSPRETDRTPKGRQGPRAWGLTARMGGVAC
jgi:hypothetical protein